MQTILGYELNLIKLVSLLASLVGQLLVGNSQSFLSPEIRSTVFITYF